MSRLFDALQKSSSEQSGVAYPDLISMVSEVFEAESPAPFSELSPAELASLPQVNVLQDIAEKTETEVVSPTAAPDFPSLNVAVAASSRFVFLTEPDSLAAEKFRFLGVRLRQIQQSRPLKKVLVSSTIPEEGKSLVSANLAGVLARRKQRILLIEGDLRRPVLAEQFGLGRLGGLAEWLQGDGQAIGNIYRLTELGFWIMPAGHPPADPLELMQSGRLSRLMQRVEEMFDWIVIDSPPLLPLADTTVWGRLSDGMLLVARVGVTDRRQLQRGLELIKKSDLLGVVLNNAEHPDIGNYYQRYAPRT